ncbi:MAG TPA: transglutaminase domain-containing protein [Kofleriaceae bacterium]|nr:transglutaminase domain-containing protein [Kofleriaceae bacterium]
MTAHVLRAILLGIAAWCSASALTGTTGTVAAVIGAIAGVAGGELAARRPWRMWVVGVGALLAILLSLLLAAGTTNRDFIPGLIGPAHALQLAAILRYGVLAFAVVAAVRTAARRTPGLGVLEIAATVAAVALPFAAHRDGQIARPLWLADYAWRHGVDPATVLVIIGVATAGALALLLMLDSDQRPRITSFAALPVIAAIAALIFAVKSQLQEAPPSEQGLEQTSKGDPPLPTTKWGQGSGLGQGDRQGSGGSNGSNQGSGATGSDGSGGGANQDGSNGNGGKPPPPPSEWQDPSAGGGKAQPMAIVLLGDDWDPPIQAYYFREETWSDLYGARLVPPRDRGIDADVPRGEPSGSLTPPVPADSPGMQLLHTDVALMVPHRKPFFLGEPSKWESTTNPDPTHFVRTYHTESVVSTDPLEKLLGHTAGASWPEGELEYYTNIPPDPRFKELANEITSKLPAKLKDDPFAKAAAIKQYLEQNVSYSLSHRHANVADPVADFLFGDRIGYCVHIAHAAVYLWRAAGIPARVGVGYMVEADHRRGSSILIRGGDAHAWPELYLDGVGWVVFDVAPAKNLDPPQKPPDDDLQQQLAEFARNAPPNTHDIDPAPKPSQRPLAGPIAIASLSLLALVVLGLYVIKIWRRVVPVFAPVGDLPRVSYRAALDQLSDAGFSREIGESREHYARRLAADVPAFGELTTMHLSELLGPRGTPRAPREKWRELLRRLRRELAAKSTPAKRFARRLDPVSFRSSR